MLLRLLLLLLLLLLDVAPPSSSTFFALLSKVWADAKNEALLHTACVGCRVEGEESHT